MRFSIIYTFVAIATYFHEVSGAAIVLKLDGHPVKHIFSFGDSYTASGFDAYGQNPTVNCSLGNPSCIQGSTWAGGHNWITSLTNVFNRTLTLTYNYAVPGYVLDSTLVTTRPSIKQNEYPAFNNTAGQKPEYALWSGQDSLFSFFIGINDIGQTFQNDIDKKAFTAEWIDVYFGIIEEIYNLGGRNFLFLNVPPTDRTPSFSGLDETAKAKLQESISLINTAIRRRAGIFDFNFDDVNVYFFDTWNAFNRILDSPTKYGFDDASSICDAENCFWHDSYHPNTYGQMIFGAQVADLLRRKGFW